MNSEEQQARTYAYLVRSAVDSVSVVNSTSGVGGVAALVLLGICAAIEYPEWAKAIADLRRAFNEASRKDRPALDLRVSFEGAMRELVESMPVASIG